MAMTARLYPRLARLLYRVTGDAGRAEDIASEAVWTSHDTAPVLLCGISEDERVAISDVTLHHGEGTLIENYGGRKGRACGAAMECG